MTTLIFASSNKNKIKEVKEILKGKYQIISLNDLSYFEELSEDGDTFEANALQKANFISHKFNTSCFAEDSGLEVHALNNEPGVYSARYAGDERSSEKNNLLLLKKLEGITDRKARFKAVISLVMNGRHYFFEGEVKGTISKKISEINGFGYDPVFIPDGYDLPFSELSPDIKNHISHRKIALDKLVHFLENN